MSWLTDWLQLPAVQTGQLAIMVVLGGWIAWVDYRTLIVPRMPFVLLGIIGAIRLMGFEGPVMIVASAGLCALALAGIGVLSSWRLGRPALGRMDPWLTFVLALWVPPLAIPFAMIVASLFTLTLLAMNRDEQAKGMVAFGPGLCTGFCALALLSHVQSELFAWPSF